MSSVRNSKLPTEFPSARFPLPNPKAREESSYPKPVETPSWSNGNGQECDDLATQETWQELVQTLRLQRRRLLRIPGVTAVDVGYKIEKGAFTNKLALRVHVERKLPKECFKQRPHDVIDPRDYPGPKGTVTMDVIEADYRPAASFQPPRRGMVLETPRRLREVNRLRRIDPLIGGISIGSPQVPVGTLGALVWDKTDGSVCILSNWHVLAGDLRAEAGNPCFQPGRFDQGRSCDVVARLKRWSFDAQTDAAIAELTGSRHYCAGEILSLFQPIAGVIEPHLGMVVLKSGRSTEFSQGFIDGLFFSTTIQYSDGVVQAFEEQIHIAPLVPEDPSTPIEPISAPGDSGAVWVTNSNGRGYLAVGLHFAGDLPHSTFGEYALANPMTVVKERLKFSFRPRFLEIRDEDVLALPLPSGSMPLQGNGIQPQGIIRGGTLTGPGGQPDPIRVEPDGHT